MLLIAVGRDFLDHQHECNSDKGEETTKVDTDEETGRSLVFAERSGKWKSSGGEDWAGQFDGNQRQTPAFHWASEADPTIDSLTS